jgi:hypothetical protein
MPPAKPGHGSGFQVFFETGQEHPSLFQDTSASIAVENLGAVGRQGAVAIRMRLFGGSKWLGRNHVCSWGPVVAELQG